MKLKSIRITNFKSIRDSNQFELADVTCLVGNNCRGRPHSSRRSTASTRSSPSTATTTSRRIIPGRM